MNYLAWLAKAFTVAPYIVAGIAQIHADAPASTKLGLATESLKLATGVADTVAPEFQPVIDAAGTAAAEIIALFTKHATAPTPVAAAAVTAPSAVASIFGK